MILRFSLLGLALAAPSYAMAQPRPAPTVASPAPRPAAQQTPPTIARTQFLREMDAEFDKIDANKDGAVSALELKQFLQVSALAFARDRNEALFKALDTDSSGQVSAAEFLKLPMGLEAPPTAVSMASDANRDQKLTKVENRTATLGNFDRMDADKDGIITPAEMKAAGLIK